MSMPDPTQSRPAEPRPGDIDPEEKRMLTLVRDTLYEGSWRDFAADLRARLEGQPYVFSIQPPSPKLRETIRHHLDLIDRLMRQND